MSATAFPFQDSWRRRKSRAFALHANSTAGATLALQLWGQPCRVYANANLSIYSAQTCNARCAFCVEELRPASRGVALAAQRAVEADDDRYLAALGATLTALQPLDPSVSITGGEPSKDPRLPAILRAVAAHGARKRTLTTNASGLHDMREGRTVLDWIGEAQVAHLNVSRAHPDCARNRKLMRLPDGLDLGQLRQAVAAAQAMDTRVRLSCVLLRGAIDSLAGVVDYLEFARGLGVDNVIFRQLMPTEPQSVQRNYVVRYSDRSRVALEPLLDAISADPRFAFVRQVMGYYYYVEVWGYRGMDVVFEEADLAQLERVKAADGGTLHELVFHPSGQLASTWQPWDGVLGPPPG